MAAGLVALRDDDVAAALFQPTRFRNRGGRTHHQAARGLHAFDQRRFRQSEVEAHHFRLEFLDRRAKGGIERRAVARRHRRRRVDAELHVIRLERLAPGMLARIVGHRRGMTEEIQIDRLARGGADFLHLRPHLLLVEHGDGQRAESAGFRHRDHQNGVHRARHRRKYDWMFDLEQVEQASVGPHMRSPGKDACL